MNYSSESNFIQTLRQFFSYKNVIEKYLFVLNYIHIYVRSILIYTTYNAFTILPVERPGGTACATINVAILQFIPYVRIYSTYGCCIFGSGYTRALQRVITLILSVLNNYHNRILLIAQSNKYLTCMYVHIYKLGHFCCCCWHYIN